jgi:cytochrome c peroxidase
MTRTLCIATTLSLLGACAGAGFDDGALRSQARSLFGRIETPPAGETREVALGRALFWDERLSLDGKTSCASCHAAADWGADRRRFSTDAKGAVTSRHSPTVFNSMTQPALRWLGDRKTGADQAEGSLTGSMGFATKPAGVARMRELGYAGAFEAAYPGEPDPVTAVNYGRAIAAYQATLSTPAPFDRFLDGDDRALNAPQKRGLSTFIAAGCAGCHSGALLGGTSYQKFGLVKDYWAETRSTKPDAGRFSMTKKEEDRYVFRVPMLRNVSKTAPYFHDGSVETLDAAVRVMASVQLGRALDEREVADIVAFLGSRAGGCRSTMRRPGGGRAASGRSGGAARRPSAGSRCGSTPGRRATRTGRAPSG